MKNYLHAGHPVVLCTDDSGVFQTSLSKEYAIAAQAFKLSNQDLCNLVLQSIHYTFLGTDEQVALKKRMQRVIDCLLDS